MISEKKTHPRPPPLRTPVNPNTNIHTFRSCVGLRPKPKIPVPPHARKTSGTQGNSPYIACRL